jgi:hypothetical protein
VKIPAANQAQDGQSDGDCPGAEEVKVVAGNGDKQSPVFDISGNSFRITVDSTATSQDPQTAGVTVFVRPEGNNSDIAADFAVEEGSDDSSIINVGPGGSSSRYWQPMPSTQ